MSGFAPAKAGRQPRGVAGYENDSGRKRKLAAETAEAFAPLSASHATAMTGGKGVENLKALLDPAVIDEQLRDTGRGTQFKLTVTE